MFPYCSRQHKIYSQNPARYARDIVGQSFDREVLAELSVCEVGPVQLLLPVVIGFDLIFEDGSLLTQCPARSP